MIVIADDITGAAEIAGIAFEYGQQVRLVCGCDTATNWNDTDVITVIATDTRSMTAADAVAETRRVAAPFADGYIFKKTDSALRGHVVEELTALMETTGLRRAVYLPANPSKERIIREGTYYIKGVPIHKTDFSFDPEFPARTSVLEERFPDAAVHGIIMPDAENEGDIIRTVREYDDGRTIFAGAADLFKIVLSFHKELRRNRQKEALPTSGFSLILCGSTQSKPLNLGIPIAPMPREVYDGEQGADEWLQKLDDSWPTAKGLILTIPHTHRTGKEVAVHLRTVMAEMTEHLVARHRPDQLIIEGGATAWATLRALGWTQFDIRRQIAPGVVQMSAPSGTLVTLKPGSYPWGGLFGED